MLAYASLVLSLVLSAAASAIPAVKREEYGTPWCKALQATCDKQMANTHDYYDFFQHDACLFGATCPPPWYGPEDGPLPSRRNVQNFFQAVCYDVGGPGTEAPTSDTLNVSTAVCDVFISYLTCSAANDCVCIAPSAHLDERQDDHAPELHRRLLSVSTIEPL